MGLGGLLRKRGAAVSGILNGIDVTVWDPSTDQLIAAPYDAERITERAKNKARLQERFGLDVSPGALV